MYGAEGSRLAGQPLASDHVHIDEKKGSSLLAIGNRLTGLTTWCRPLPLRCWAQAQAQAAGVALCAVGVGGGAGLPFTNPHLPLTYCNPHLFLI